MGSSCVASKQGSQPDEASSRPAKLSTKDSYFQEGIRNRTEPNQPNRTEPNRIESNRLILEPAGTGTNRTEPHRATTRPKNAGRTASNREI